MHIIVRIIYVILIMPSSFTGMKVRVCEDAAPVSVKVKMMMAMAAHD